MIRMPVIVAAAVALASAVLLGPRDTSAQTAPLKVLASGHPTAEITVSGQGGFSFIIDTAATRTVLLPAFAATYDGALETLRQEIVPGASGEALMEVTPIRALSLAGRTFDRLDAWTLPPSAVDQLPVHGVLGADILARFAVEMDPRAERWALHDNHRARPGLDYRPFELDEGDTPLMIVTINGVELTAIVDTGAQGSVLNDAAAHSLGLRPDDPSAVSAGQARGTGGGGVEMTSYCVPGVMIDGRRARPERLRVANLPIFGALGLESEPALILGYDLLGRGVLVIDYPQRRIGFGQFEVPASC